MPFAPSFQLRQMLSDTDHTDHAHASDPFVDPDIPASPPVEVLEAVARAAEAFAALEASGRRLSFTLAPGGGGLQACLQDADGNLITTLTPGRVLELAGGDRI